MYVVLTLCNLRWGVFSSYQLAQILHLYSWRSSPAICTNSVFSKPNNPTGVHNAYECTLQLALCGGGCGDSVYIYTCVCVCERAQHCVAMVYVYVMIVRPLCCMLW